MSGQPDHAELLDLLPAAALEMLDQADAHRLAHHLGQCAECAGQLEEYQGVAARLGLLLPLQEMDPSRAASLRARLLLRARRERRPRRARRVAFLAERWAGWLVAAGLAGVTLIHHGLHRPLAYGWVAAGVLCVLLALVGWYAQVQRRRVTTLELELRAVEREEGAARPVDQAGDRTGDAS